MTITAPASNGCMDPVHEWVARGVAMVLKGRLQDLRLIRKYTDVL